MKPGTARPPHSVPLFPSALRCLLLAAALGTLAPVTARSQNPPDILTGDCTAAETPNVWNDFGGSGSSIFDYGAVSKDECSEIEDPVARECCEKKKESDCSTCPGGNDTEGSLSGGPSTSEKPEEGGYGQGEQSITPGSGGGSTSAGNSDMTGTGKQDRNTCEISPAAQTDGSNGKTGVTVIGGKTNQLGGGMLKTIPLGANRTYLGPGTVTANAEEGRAQPIALRHISYQLAAANLNDDVYSRAYGRLPGVQVGDYEVTAGKIEWIRSENIFADFMNLSGGSPPLGFMIKLYTSDQVTGTTPSGSPFHTLEIRKLSASGSTLRMRVLEYGERNYVTEYRYTPNGTAGKIWEVLEGTHGGALADGTSFTALRRTLMASTVNSGVSPAEYTEDHKIYGTHASLNGGTEELLSHKTWKFKKYTIGDRLIQTVNDPSGKNLAVDFVYYTAGAADGKIKQINYPDGDWRRYEYDATTARRSKIVKPYLGTPAPAAGSAVPASGVETIDYTNPSTGSRTITRSLNSQVVSKTWHTRSGSASTGYTWTHTKAHTPSAAEGASDNFKTQYVYFGTSASAPATNRLKYIVSPDGLIRQFQYSNPVAGVLRIDTTEGRATGSYPFTFSAGTLSREEFTASGQLILKTVWSLDSGMGSDPLQELEVTSLDNRGRPLVWSDNLTGRNRLLSYACCGLAYERDFNGQLTVYTYDSLGNSIRVEKGYPASFSPTNIINGYISDYSAVADALGRHRIFTRTPHGGGTAYTYHNRYFNLAGELYFSTDALNKSTYYRTDLTTGTLSGNTVRVVRRFVSYPSSGSPSYYRTSEATGFPEGRPWTSRVFASSTTCAAGSPSPVTGAENLKLSLSHAYAATVSGGITVTTTNLGYSGSVNRWASITSDMLGRVIGTSRPSWNSATAVSTASAYYASADSGVSGYSFGRLKWSEDEDSVRTFHRYNSMGEPRDTILDLNGNDAIDDSSDRVTRIERTYLVDGGVWPGALRKTVSKVLTTGTTELIVNEDWRSVTGDWWGDVTFNMWNNNTRYWSGSTPGAFTEEYIGGDGSYREDSYGNGRISNRWEDYGVSGVSTFYSYDGFGRLNAVDDFDRKGTTTYSYYANDQVWKVTEPGGRVTEYVYDNLGQTIQITPPGGSDQSRTYFAVGGLKSQSGFQTYPVEYTYDSYGGRLSTMTTHYGPSSTSAVTTWNYSGYRNLLTSKTDAASNSYNLGYTAAGRAKTRTWARGKHTRYDYDSAGQLNWKRYFTASASDTGSNAGNDSDTGDVNILQERNGRTTGLTTGYKAAFPGTSLSLGYATANYWQSTSQTLAVDPDLASSASPGATAASLVRTLWPTYDGADRVSGYDLRDGVLSSDTWRAGAVYTFDTKGRISTVKGTTLAGSDRTFTYGWLQGAVDLIDTVTGPAHTVDNNWDPLRDLLDTKTNIKNSGGTTISGFDYTLNTLNQRTAVAVTGSPAGGYTWGYNSAGELVTADHSAVSAYDTVFQYDDIGNRRKAAGGTLTLPGSDTATINSRNQYTTFHGVSHTHDTDGNMTADGGGNTAGIARTYTWDGENRLIKVTQVSSGATVAEYLYDALGRRVAKAVSGTRTYFVYDGWNVVAEFTGSVHTTGSPPALTHTKTHLWGLDLSNSFQGSGGVGGLLATDIKTGGTTGVFFPSYDGNGNIIDYINTSGTAIAHYEYNPMGHLHTSSGSASLFNYRFSTKFNDSETDFYYYGHRYYSTWMARWLNRDPIEELGGENIMGMCRNDCINFYDYLGLKIDCDELRRKIQEAEDKLQEFDKESDAIDKSYTQRITDFEKEIKNQQNVIDNFQLPQPAAGIGIAGSTIGLFAAKTALAAAGTTVSLVGATVGLGAMGAAVQNATIRRNDAKNKKDAVVNEWSDTMNRRFKERKKMTDHINDLQRMYDENCKSVCYPDHGQGKPGPRAID